MRALTDALLAALGLVIAVAVLGDELSRVIDSLAVPLCALIVAVALVRLTWFFTRW